jgi:hypothetical protein
MNGLFIHDCPRCSVKRTGMLALSSVKLGSGFYRLHEVFSGCNSCRKTTVFLMRAKSEHSGKPESIPSVTMGFEILSYVSLRDFGATAPPEHLPPHVESSFKEAATCLAVKCYNAAGTMFRNCLDLATKDLLSQTEATASTPPTKDQRGKLAFRLEWLFTHGALPPDLRDLAKSVKDDGNDAAHGASIGEAEAQDLLDFTEHLLERVYTFPQRVILATERRQQRRNATS